MWVIQSCPTATTCIVAHQAPLSLEFFQARILEWVAMPSSRGLPDPWIKSRSLALQADPLLYEPPVQFSPVTQPCPTLCNPMNRSMPGLPVHHQLLESTQTHVHEVSDAIQPSSVIPFSSCPQSFPASGAFQMSQLFPSGGQRIGVSASTSVLPMNARTDLL